MTYPEAIEFLYQLRVFGTKMGLENTFALAELFGSPQERLRFIHVAGTNGKGSTCAMLEGIYRAAGLRVGLFTSPHLVTFTERIQVNRERIGETDVARLADELRGKLGGAASENWPLRPTFFEFVTVMALRYFAEQKCELVIWETGLGGRLDSTNIVQPLASLITNIQYDHQQWLGNTLEEIAREKAGIIKEGVPVITASKSPEALKVIRETAAAKNAPLIVTSGEEFRERFPDIRLSLLGQHQESNAAVAVATVEGLQGQLPVDRAVVEKALSRVIWPGRLQLVRLDDSEVLLDGAHNPDGARTLAEALRTGVFAGKEITLILGVFKDKAWTEMCEVLAPLAARVLLVPVQSDRSADLPLVRSFCQNRWPGIPVTITDSAASALARARQYPFVVVAGSLHLIGEVMERLHVAGSAPSELPERPLNEWDAGRKA